MLRRGAVDVTLHDVVQRCAGGFQTAFHLFENKFGLALDRRRNDLAGVRIERRQARDKDHVAGAGHRRCDQCSPPLKVGGDRFDAQHFSFHRKATFEQGSMARR
jgi:hypothetical protein